MPKLSSCSSCCGFLPPRADQCPHCDAVASPAASPRRGRFARLSRALFELAGGSAVALTLMACYGAGAPYRGAHVRPQPHQQCAPEMDRDRDGVCAPEDCDDNRRDVYPGATDRPGDGVDQNCDGVDGIAPAAPPKARATEPAPGAPPPASPAPASTTPKADTPARATEPAPTP